MLEEEVRDLSTMSLDGHEAEWREMDELTRERVPARSSEAGMAREEPQKPSRENRAVGPKTGILGWRCETVRCR